jgi:hypothetical protein
MWVTLACGAASAEEAGHPKPGMQFGAEQSMIGGQTKPNKRDKHLACQPIVIPISCLTKGEYHEVQTS